MVFLSQNIDISKLDSGASQEDLGDHGSVNTGVGNESEKIGSTNTHQNNSGSEEKEARKGRVLPKKNTEQGQSGASQQKIKELTEILQRLQAEFENYQKRTAKQNEELIKMANANLMEELLLVLDSLEQGMQHEKSLALVYEQLYSILKKKGLQKIRAERGMDFDHNKMECLMQEKNSELAYGKVCNVILSGYELNDKILRPAKVSVNIEEKKEGSNTTPNNEKKNSENAREE